AFAVAFVPLTNLMLIGLALSPFGQTALLGGLVSGLFLLTVKEVKAPQASGDPLVGITLEGPQAHFDPNDLFAVLLGNKVLMALSGFGIGWAVGLWDLPLLQPAMLSYWSLGAALLVIAVILWDQEIPLAPTIGFLLITVVWFRLESLLTTGGYPVISLSIAMFFIPINLAPSGKEVRADEPLNHNPGIRWSHLPLYLLGASAGVNFNTFNTALNNASTAFFTGISVEVLLEFIALGRMINTEASGLTAVASEIRWGINPWLVLSAIAFGLILTQVAWKIIRYERLNLGYLSVGIGVVILLMLNGWLGIPLLIAGLASQKITSQIPQSVKGLMFLGPLLFG
ncbi:MAG: hypothetical protein ABEK59_05195, partial [Halobacteria archaeon]